MSWGVYMGAFFVHRIYNTQIEVAVLQTSWIKEVLQRRCQVCEVALGHHLLLPDWLELKDIPGTNKQVGGKQLDSRLYTKVREQEEGMCVIDSLSPIQCPCELLCVIARLVMHISNKYSGVA